MTTDPEAPFTLVFVGYTDAAREERAAAYEDAVLPLLADHGAELVYRGQRVAGQDSALPLEVHLTRFPHRRALAAYMADDRRAALLEEFGEVFTTKQVVEMDTVVAVGTDTVAGTVPVAPSQEVPAENYAPTWAGDTRTPLPLAAGERETLTAYLEWHRQTFELKCAGVPPEQMSDRGVPPSGLSLHGLVRHLAGVERWWFRIQFAGEDVPLIYYSDDDPNQDFDRLDGDVAEALAVWRAECERSREILARAASLDETGIHRASGKPVSLRRILVHIVAEYARHNGHADLLRERIDGQTGL
jgi:uncharacterized damage-inducible protein DinB